MNTVNRTEACPTAHRSCAAVYGRHRCWRNPGHPGGCACVCYYVWPRAATIAEEVIPRDPS